MARNFRRQRSAHPIADVNVTNLIDLGFILLVIFMIATPLMRQEETIPVELPTLAPMPQKKVKPDDRFIAVSVDAGGRFYVENRKVPLTVAELRTQLRAYANEAKPPVIRIRGDAESAWKRVAELFTEVEKAGLVRFTIDYQTKD